MKLILAELALALLIAGPASAQAPPPPGGPPQGRVNRLSTLGLNADQMKRVQDVLKDFGPKMRDLEKSLFDRRRTLEGLYDRFDLDLGQARQLNKQINGIQKDILDQHLKLQVELRKILTADQYSKMRQGMHRRPMERRDAPWERPPR
ncbi:MAG TPA: periplasmic heavy metal sensor [Armatimonadota bacterium]|jgi:Spy/CpxP family protein refolding chaperone